MSFASFEELAKSRRDWYEISKKNGFVEGIERLLTKLYPDKAHFIFELLQNAEDAFATRVEFRLEADSLVFIHNGRRLFNLRDVESITSIADSTKRDDGTSIGKFGIGFKAVFAYTETPMIHSGEWHFMISHMVVPERCDKDADLQLEQEGKTFFRFPFNKKQKNPVRAYTEILDGLKTLSPESILFLRNISEVYVSYADKEQFITKNTKDHLVELLKLTGEGQETSSRYLLFSKNIEEMSLEDGSSVGPMSVGVGYRLKERDNGRSGSALRLSDRFEITSVERRNVYVFFPAEKETSGLRFCLHAPFASTAARDSICDTVDNRNLMGVVSGLQVDSLTYLRDEGFLTTDFLSVLPNSKDSLGDMYSCFRENLVAVFRNEAFTPKKYGGFSPAQQLYCGPSSLSDIFNDEELSDLAWIEPVAWMKNASQQNSNADRFLDDLDVDSWNVHDLVSLLATFSDGWDDEDHEEAVKKVFAKKNNTQLAAVYALIEDCESSRDFLHDSRIEELKDAPIFRTSDGSFAAASEGLVTGVPVSSQDGGVRVKYIHPEITNGDRSPKQKEKVDRFLRRLGIEPFSDETMMKMFVHRYWEDDDCEITAKQSADNLSILIRLVIEGRIEAKVASGFPVLNEDGKYVRLGKTFIDEPYVHTGLACYAGPLCVLGVTQLSRMYVEWLGQKDIRNLVEKSSSFGIRKELWLVDSPIFENPRRGELWDFSRRSSSYERGSDYDIPGLDKFVSSPTPDQAKLIWEFVLSRSAGYLVAEYRANLSDPGRSVPAKFIQTLAGAKWIPIQGQYGLFKPADVSLESLLSDWRRPKDGYEHRALKAMGFGRETKLRQAEQEKKEQVLKESGFKDSEEVDELREIKKACQERGLTPRQALSQLAGDKRQSTHTPKELPKRSASNVNQRMSIASTNFQKASKQTYVVVGRSVHVGNSHIRDAARTYLRSEYESNGEMFCQLCHSSMPFKGRDGYGYFEATQVFARMKKDITEQFISLCPTCRAKYDEWVRRSQDRSRAFKDAILKHKPQQGEESVAIPLPGESENGVKSPLSGKSVYFTGTHFVDLRQAVLENEKLGGLDDFTELEPAATGMSQNQSFVDWYLKYDPEGEAALRQITNAFGNLEKCQQQGKKLGVVMWTTCSEGYLKKVMTFWDDYHSQNPTGESQADASLSVERYCKSQSKRQ